MRKIFILLVCFSAGSSIANEHTHLFSGGFNSNVGVLFTPITTATVAVAGGYAYGVSRNWQLGFSGKYTLSSTAGISYSNWILVAGPIYSFGGADRRSDFFLSAGLGFWNATATAAIPSTAFVFAATLGKRFKIFDNVSYSPNVTLNVPTYSTSLLFTTLTFNILDFSILF